MANEAIVSSIEKLESSLNNKYENTIHIVSETTDIRQKLVSDKRIEFVAHAPIGHVKLKLKPGVKVNFDHNKSFNTLLGLSVSCTPTVLVYLKIVPKSI